MLYLRKKLLINLFYIVANNLYSLIYAAFTGVDNHIIIDRVAPVLTCIVIVIRSAFSIFFFQFFERFVINLIAAQLAVCVICRDKEMVSIIKIFQNEIGTAADENTGAFLSQCFNRFGLRCEQIIVVFNVQIAEHRFIRRYTAVQIFVCQIEFIQAYAFFQMSGDESDEFSVIKRNLQLFCQFFGHFAAACAVLTANGDNHNNPPY